MLLYLSCVCITTWFEVCFELNMYEIRSFLVSLTEVTSPMVTSPIETPISEQNFDNIYVNINTKIVNFKIIIINVMTAVT